MHVDRGELVGVQRSGPGFECAQQREFRRVECIPRPYPRGDGGHVARQRFHVLLQLRSLAAPKSSANFCSTAAVYFCSVWIFSGLSSLTCVCSAPNN